MTEKINKNGEVVIEGNISGIRLRILTDASPQKKIPTIYSKYAKVIVESHAKKPETKIEKKKKKIIYQKLV